MAQLRSPKKADPYPSKNSLNLFYKEDRTTRPATIALYCMFAAAVLLLLAKLGVYDPLMELRDLRSTLADRESQLSAQLEYLAGYDEVSSRYARYSYSYLQESEMLCDRVEVLDMLEDTVFSAATLDSMSVSGNILSIRFFDLDLEASAAIAREIEGYGFVKSVTVSTASLAGSESTALTTDMLIELLADTTGGDAQ